MSEVRKRLGECREEYGQVERQLRHALMRAEAIGDLPVPPGKRRLKADIIDRYNDDIDALSARLWALESEIEDLEGSPWR